ncbi:MAG: hypothetical protein LBT16_01100, partial [Treponema sp.]|nr:hypothetical protein [Treponema sp.]
KKAVAVLVVLAVFSTTLFAAPLSVKTLPDMSSFNAKVKPAGPLAGDGALFAGVSGSPLTGEEAAKVEGEGLLGAIFAAVGCVLALGTLGGFLGYSYAVDKPAFNNAGSAAAGALFGGLGVGGMLGAGFILTAIFAPIP